MPLPMAAMENEPGLASLIRRIVHEEVQRMLTKTDKPVDYYSQSLEEIVQEEVEKALVPVAVKPVEPRQRPTYAAAKRKPFVPFYSPPVETRKTDVQRTADNFPVCFHCGRPGHVVRSNRDRKAVSDSYRVRRQNLISEAQTSFSDLRLPQIEADLQITVALPSIQSVSKP
ncbi:hypothetical protein AVEN_239216-1 [Araneus ventricosus]|uniref:CCHC-type domain-containing protein n=1 Tax=Araneus ventricosus TaxID=182803 RepID=A0A4Y2JMB0_ARAVE|nr:hypothetical protein AVEN_239216-1 [Araneus ventricosus]